ncbi:uncharacterized protein LOC120462742 [Pimephales promelas]|uniref:uncharacterized protein LOC120462742 n=1 Tax=Pimephales promelas TaxID=90988 RepID=UPI001955884B|nr:uncharacterized protein LOC120462742 [Pimephales promelas]XP_039507331.1 uncharacterized protein LOC120462742 [Pimephales promelas]
MSDPEPCRRKHTEDPEEQRATESEKMQQRGIAQFGEVLSQMNIFGCFALWACITVVESPEPLSIEHGCLFEGTHLSRFSGVRGARRRGGTRGESRHHSRLRSLFDPGLVMSSSELHSLPIPPRPESTHRHQRRWRRGKTSSLPKCSEAVPHPLDVLPEAQPEIVHVTSAQPETVHISQREIRRCQLSGPRGGTNRIFGASGWDPGEAFQTFRVRGSCS